MESISVGASHAPATANVDPDRVVLHLVLNAQLRTGADKGIPTV